MLGMESSLLRSSLARIEKEHAILSTIYYVNVLQLIKI